LPRPLAAVPLGPTFSGGVSPRELEEALSPRGHDMGKANGESAGESVLVPRCLYCGCFDPADVWLDVDSMRRPEHWRCCSCGSRHASLCEISRRDRVPDS
jgi:hypothetical protein